MQGDAAEQIDVQAEIDRYFAWDTCETCGGSCADSGESYYDWYAKVEKKEGYTSKHWKRWRSCKHCKFKQLILLMSQDYYRFAADTFVSIRDATQVQPMSDPSASMFYLDFVHGSNPVNEQVLPEGPTIPMDLVYGNVDRRNVRVL